MVRVFVGVTKIFFRVRIKRLLTAGRTEIIGLPLVLGCASGGGGVNVHSANGIMYCSCHISSFCLDYASIFRGQEAQENVDKDRQNSLCRFSFLGFDIFLRLTLEHGFSHL